MTPTGYIYEIKAIVPPLGENGIYVGQTAQTIIQRFYEHCTIGQTIMYIDRYLQKHGKDSVVVSEVEKVYGFSRKNLRWKLNQREKY